MKFVILLLVCLISVMTTQAALSNQMHNPIPRNRRSAVPEANTHPLSAHANLCGEGEDATSTSITQKCHVEVIRRSRN
ncbi:hypothetical protein ANCCAN_12596 [Ancylostoma caninum]|uniref:Uncharacterized protein n=1 Tax=Ancylostoma caninum TaxID=29170 RepID=A0A368GF93_ANCCA|nr:hypothetical protein ANCCAN_12596 [Ancylostoma caninum]